jgi:hypothetical protein
MENLATWRTLYSLRYCPITLIQTVFSAGTVYLLTATQASSGIRVAWKEMDHATKQLDRIMEYLQEIGASWQCATNIAGILKGLMQDQPRLLLNGKAIDVHGSLQVHSPEDDDERTSQGYRDRMSARKESAVRSRSRANSKSKVLRRASLSRGPIARPIVPVGQESETIQNAAVPIPQPSSIQNQSLPQAESLNISIQIPSHPSSISGSPASQSFIEARTDIPQYNSPTAVSPLSDTSNERRDSSPNASFDQTLPNGRFSYTSWDQQLSQSWDALRAFDQEQQSPTSFATRVPLDGSFNMGGPSAQPYLSTEITGFTGMLGGQTLPQFPSFGIPINANGPFLHNPPSSSSNHFYLSEGTVTPRHLQMGSFDNMDEFEQLLVLGD